MNDQKKENSKSELTESESVSASASASQNPVSVDKYLRWKAGAFLATITSMSVLAGFGLTMGMAKRADPNMFEKGLGATKELPESGASLATRALLRGTMYSCTGFGLLCFAIWKMMGVNSLVEFREKAGTVLPKIPKSENPGRGDFRTLRDLLEYIIAEDEKEKVQKTKLKEQSSSS